MLSKSETDQILPNLDALSPEMTVDCLKQRLAEDAAAHAAELAALRVAHETEMVRIAQVHEAALVEAAQIHKTALAEVAQTHAAELAKVKAECRLKIDAVLEQVRIANARYWGASTEKIRPEQLSLFNDVEATCEPEATEPALDDLLVGLGELTASAPKRPRKPKRLKAELLKDLPVVVVDHDIAEDERVCPQCGSTLAEMNIEVSKRLEWIPGHFKVKEHRRHIYACSVCNDENAQGAETPAVIIRAAVPRPPIDKAMATASTIAFIICEKYAYSKPLYRIETTFAHGGVALSRATMSNWVIAVANRWFALIYERMKELLRAGDIIHCDETWVQVLKEPRRDAQTKSYMWVFATPECAAHQIVVFEYHPTRAASVPKAFFKDWTGYVQCDGYDAYHNLGENITIAGCLAHIRRHFMDIAKGVGINKLPASSACAIALRHLKKIFDTERTFAGMTPDERKGARDKDLAPLLDDFFTWANDTASEAVGKTAIKEALQYSVNQETYIRNILKDGRLDLTNNSCERRIRPFAIARRNNLFSDTPRGADASAILFSVVQSALANGLKPYEYLTWVLDGLPNAALDADPKVIDDFLPWSAKIPQNFKMNSEERTAAAKEPVLLGESVDVESLERALRDQERLIQATEQG